jgi:hypothetical protein
MSVGGPATADWAPLFSRLRHDTDACGSPHAH